MESSRGQLYHAPGCPSTRTDRAISVPTDVDGPIEPLRLESGIDGTEREGHRDGKRRSKPREVENVQSDRLDALGDRFRGRTDVHAIGGHYSLVSGVSLSAAVQEIHCRHRRN